MPRMAAFADCDVEVSSMPGATERSKQATNIKHGKAGTAGRSANCANRLCSWFVLSIVVAFTYLGVRDPDSRIDAVSLSLNFSSGTRISVVVTSPGHAHAEAASGCNPAMPRMVAFADWCSWA
jgi:hypothetical protein